jgi:hypothetical protein
VRIVAPGLNARVRRNVSVRAVASDDTGVSSMQLLVDGRPRPAVRAASLTSVVRRLARGRHTLVVRAYDARGNAGSRTVRVRVAR